LTGKNTTQYEVLVEKVKAGEREAFGELIKKYDQQIFVYCLSILKEKHDAEDATADAFERAFREIHQLIDNWQFKNWLYTIAKRTSLDILNKRKKEEDIEESTADDQSIPSSIESPEKIIEHKEISEIVRRELMKLSRNDREIIVLRYYVKFTTEETADFLGISIGAVKSRLFRAIVKLGKRLKPHKGLL